MARRHRLRLFAAGFLIVAGTFGAVAALYRVGYLGRFDLLAYDIGVNQRSGSGAIDGRVAIVGVTEEDSVRFGWPLPDEVLAEAIERLVAAGTRVVAVDFFRDHPVEPGGARLDRALRDNAGVIWISRMGDPDHAGIDPPQALIGTRRYGFADIPLDDDGIVRRALLYQQVDGTVGASFALTAAQAYLRHRGIKTTPAPSDPAAIALGKAVFEPLDPDDGAYVDADTGGFQIMIDFVGGRLPFRLASLGALLDGAVPADELRDRIVFVGTTTESVKDFFYTPLDLFGSRLQSTYGIVLHALIASQILSRAIDGSAAKFEVGATVELAWILLWAAGGGIVGYLGSSALRLSLFVALGVVASIAFWYVALTHWVWLPFVAPLLAWSLSAALMLPATLGYRRLIADRDRSFIREAFDRFLAPEVIDAMVAKGALPTLGGEERVVTVLFADMENYSTLSERISPTETVSIINQIFTSLTAIVQSRRGIVVQFIGDAMVAVFNAPVDDPDHAANAVFAALECDTAMRDLMGRIELPTDTRVRMRFGINTGRMVVGNIGSERRLNYTAIGDGINVAARLEGTNKVYATSVIASEDTVRDCGDRIVFREIDRVAVKGRSRPIRIFEPLGQDDPRLVEIAAFEAARALCAERRFAEAADAFARLHPVDPTAAVLAKRCRAYALTPPDAGWDGVFVLSEK